MKYDLFDRSKKFIDPLYQVWEDMSAEELQEFKKPIKKVNKVVISIHFLGISYMAIDHSKRVKGIVTFEYCICSFSHYGTPDAGYVLMRRVSAFFVCLFVKDLYIYFWRCWVFVAVWVFCSFDVQGLLCCGVWVSHGSGFSHCGAWAPGARASVGVARELSCSTAVGSSQTRD